MARIQCGVQMATTHTVNLDLDPQVLDRVKNRRNSKEIIKKISMMFENNADPGRTSSWAM